MARVTVEDCLEKIPNRFALTVLGSRRARALSEGRATPLVQCSNKAAVTALREIAQGGVRYVEDVNETMLAFIHEQRALLQGASGMDHNFIGAVSFGPMGADPEDVEEYDVKELTSDLASLGTGETSESEEGSEGVAEKSTPEGEGSGSEEGTAGTEEDVPESGAEGEIDIGEAMGLSDAENDDDDDDDDASSEGNFSGEAEPAT